MSKLGKKNKDSKAANDKKMQQLDALMRRQAQKKQK